jgi:hypothetical protein
MGKTYKWEERTDPRSTKQSAKLKAKEQGKQTKQFWRNVASQQHKDAI